MSIRLAKQLIYGAFYLILWFLFFWGCYGIVMAFRTPTMPAPIIQPVKIIFMSAFATPGMENHKTFLAQVENLNADFASPYFDYSFQIYDASGASLGSFPAQNYLYAHEIKYILLPNESVSHGVATAELVIPTTTTTWVASSSFGPAPQLKIENLNTNITSSTVVVSGRILDNDTASFSGIGIIAVLKDITGKPIGASQTSLDAIQPGESQPFTISYPVVAGVSIFGTEVGVSAYRR